MSQALIESLRCNLGRTVTIFTTSGGLSGSGFTGVLVDVTPCVVKIITQIGAPPACAGVIWVLKKTLIFECLF